MTFRRSEESVRKRENEATPKVKDPRFHRFNWQNDTAIPFRFFSFFIFWRLKRLLLSFFLSSTSPPIFTRRKKIVEIGRRVLSPRRDNLEKWTETWFSFVLCLARHSPPRSPRFLKHHGKLNAAFRPVTAASARIFFPYSRDIARFFLISSFSLSLSLSLSLSPFFFTWFFPPFVSFFFSFFFSLVYLFIYFLNSSFNFNKGVSTNLLYHNVPLHTTQL